MKASDVKSEYPKLLLDIQLRFCASIGDIKNGKLLKQKTGIMREKWFCSMPSPSLCIQKWGLQCIVNLEQSAPVYLMEFKLLYQYEKLPLLQVRVWLSKCGADAARRDQQGWPVMGFWELSSYFSVFYLGVCWDRVKLSRQPTPSDCMAIAVLRIRRTL